MKVTNYEHKIHYQNDTATESEKTYSNVLILHIPQALQDTSTNSIAQILSGRFGMNISKINSSVQALGTSETLKGISREGHIRSHG